MAEFDESLLKDTDDDSDLVKKLRAQLRDHRKVRGDLEAEVSTLRGKDRVRSVSEILKSKGVPEKVAKLLPADIDPSEDAIGAWLEEFGDVIGVKVDKPAGDKPDVDEDTVTSYRDLANAVDSMSTPNVGLTALHKKVAGAQTREEAAAALAEAAALMGFS